jgi:hypothetical protein
MCSTSFKLPVCSVCRDNMEEPSDLSVRGTDLPEWITNEFLPTRNFPGQIVDRSFLRAINASVHRRKNFRYVDFTNSNYKDVPTEFPVDVNTMIAFGKANKLELHLYGYSHIYETFKKSYIDDTEKKIKIGGLVFPIYNSERGIYDAKVFLLVHDKHVYPIKKPLKILSPNLTSYRGVYCLKCGLTFSTATLKNIHYDLCLLN